ncbi:MAG: hypothetical protein EOO91_01385 [Pedobacter sp.]|nr:MAG: hypothetical protein EOO91_01385 [Pedobacter sp.]
MIISNEELFKKLYVCATEEELEKLITVLPEIFKDANWLPIDNNYSNYGIIENQQSNPIAALVEKLTNSIDAILTKKCLEAGVDPGSQAAPRSMQEAVQLFYPDHKNWDITTPRKKQAENIQVIADGPTRNTSVIIYDDGEGQHPKDFLSTFLSLVKGNKNKVMFVQGKYNMGGSGSIVFCGKLRYQLIASKKFDNSGDFGFTLIREHPFSEQDAELNKNTWYEYLTADDGQIRSFDLKGELDLNLLNRQFRTGTIIKMYSYQFPIGYSGFAQDLNQSFNEFLFEPLLPIYTIDNPTRYPNNVVLQLELFGLKRRLESDQNYIEESFSETYTDELFGEIKVSCYVFKPKVGNNDLKKTKENIKRAFFKNNMSVMFSLNGQTHGHYTTEFITQTLKFNLLKDYLLIHVDCTKMKQNFRKELFMASRDRLKAGTNAKDLRDYLGKKLRNSRLDEINKRRKDLIGLNVENTSDLLKSFAKNLNKDSDLFKFLQNTLKLEDKNNKPDPKQHQKKESHPNKEKVPFHPKRFPSFFKLQSGKTPAISLPKDGEKSIKFETDVENEYFDRTDEPGELEISLLSIKRNDKQGGDEKGSSLEISTVLNVTKSSPIEGAIKIVISPTQELQLNDELEIKISLSSPGETFEEMLWIKIKEKEAPKIKVPNEEEPEFEGIGLPELVKIKKEQWEGLQSQGIDMGHKTVIYPIGEGDMLEKIYINMDSTIFLNNRSRLKTEDQINAAEKRYLSSVYFHSLFIYMITKKRNYKLQLPKDGEFEDVTIDEYIRDVFDNYYSDFLLNFGMDELMQSLDD